IVFPRSHCPNCRVTLKIRNLLPVLSYLAQGGRCSYCAIRISPVYPLVELITALSFFAVFLWGPSGFVPKLVGIILISTLIVITFIDIRFQIIPDLITLPGVVTGLLIHGMIHVSRLAGWVDSPSLTGFTFWDSLLGALVGGAVLWVVAVVSEMMYGQVGMGGGDVKLAALIGAFIGWKGVLRALLASFFLGALIGGFMMIIRVKKRRDYIPFGPFLALGSGVAFFYPIERIAVWYLNAVGGTLPI
ncbi:MAG: A24 family peptidase, partial [bacterium]|nr:A24 family peptidase [bacterium]